MNTLISIVSTTFMSFRDLIVQSSGEPLTKLFRYLLLIETKKAHLIGQSATR